MAKAWPAGIYTITVTNGLSVGAVDPLGYMRVGKMGLVKNGNTYQVVAAYVRGTLKFNTSYESTIYTPTGRVGQCLYKSGFIPPKGGYTRNFELGTLGISDRHQFTSGGKKLTLFDPLACGGPGSGNLLKKIVNKGYNSYDHTVNYYKKENGYFATFFTYEVKTVAAANDWVAKHRRAVPSTAGGAVFDTATDEEDRLSGGSGLLHIQMQAALDQNADYKNARYHQGNADPRNNSDIPGLVTKILTERGYTADAIRQFLNPTTTGGGGGVTSSGVPTTGNGNPTGQNPTPNVAPTPAITKVIVRAPYGYSTPPAKAPDTRPQIVQNYVDFIKDPSTTSGYKERAGQEIFHFPYAPNNVSYSGLGSEWTNIDRQGNYPLVEWAKWQLMRVELEFLLAEDRLVSGGAKVPDGIFVSVQNRLNVIRRMAQRQAPVSVFNLDDLFRVQVRRAAKTGKAMQFVIADMNVKSSRRSMDSIEKEITSATVRLTLQEMPVENITIAKMSPPQLTDPVIPRKAGDGDGELTSDPLWWSGVQPKLT